MKSATEWAREFKAQQRMINRVSAYEIHPQIKLEELVEAVREEMRVELAAELMTIGHGLGMRKSGAGMLAAAVIVRDFGKTPCQHDWRSHDDRNSDYCVKCGEEAKP